MRTIIRAICAAGLLLAPIGAAAQDYPERAVTFVIPFPPGGSSDVYARYLTERLSKRWASRRSSRTWEAPVARSAWPTSRV